MATSTMKKLSLPLSIAAAAGLAFGTATTANAGTFSYSGSGFSIPDNNTTGGSSTITITDNSTITDITVTLNNLTHTWLGDLTASLTNINTGTTVDLFNRVGRTGGSGVGDSSNFGDNYNFNTAYTGNLWTTAAGLGDSSNIPSGNYFPTTVNGGVSLLSAFNGQSLQGTWVLNIKDSFADDTGSLGSWNISGQSVSVPEPASVLGLLAFGAMGASSVVKRKQQQKAMVKA
jgi:hypothetical protein